MFLATHVFGILLCFYFLSNQGIHASPIQTGDIHGICVDKHPKCSDLGEDVCKKYFHWAQDNCIAFCDFCPTPVPARQTTQISCRDLLPMGSLNYRCSDIGGYQVCIDFADWSRDYCPAYCGFCHGCIERISIAILILLCRITTS